MPRSVLFERLNPKTRVLRQVVHIKANRARRRRQGVVGGDVLLQKDGNPLQRPFALSIGALDIAQMGEVEGVGIDLRDGIQLSNVIAHDAVDIEKHQFLSSQLPPGRYTLTRPGDSGVLARIEVQDADEGIMDAGTIQVAGDSP